MSGLVTRIASFALSFLIPPRPTERLVSRTSLSELRALAQGEKGLYEALLPYHEPRVKALVWELKYYRNDRARELAGSLLSERVAEICAEELTSVLLIPIPMHASRKHARGDNHTEALCREIGERVGCRVVPLLEKNKETVRQVELPAAARRENLRHSFSVAHEHVRLTTCVVIDDVTTTGATFEEAVRALSKAGASRIICLALARS